jgi:hypothetical protein
MRRTGAVVTLLAALAGLALPSGAAGAPPPPSGLRVSGGSEIWHPDSRFTLGWDVPEGASPPVAAIHYLVTNSQGEVAIAQRRIEWASESVSLQLPDGPGVYTAEVWFEDGAGAQGPPASAELRFDDVPPADVSPLPVSGWVGRNAFPLAIQIAHPAGPPPVSGIRGYAVSVDRSPLGSPCAGPPLCETTETDLLGGVDADLMVLPQLPEGISYLHAVAVSGAGVGSAHVGNTAVRVDQTDPSTHIEGAPSGWADTPVTLTARAADADSGMAAADGAFTALRLDGGAPAIGTGGEARMTVIGEGIHTVAYYARDAAGNVNDGATLNGEANHAAGFATVRIDRTPPRVAFSNSQAPDDPEAIRARVQDQLSGGSVSRGSIAVRRAGSDGPFDPLPTSASAGGLTARWDSDSFPPGVYEFRATGYDAAGNLTVSTARADGSAMVLTNPIKATSVLVAGFAGGGRSKRTVPYGRRTRFAGHLTAGWRRNPIAYAPVRIVQRFAGGRPQRVSTVTTAEDGTFSLRLAAGPSREVLARFDGNRAFAGAGARTATLLVRSAVRLGVSRHRAEVGGTPVVFRGRVSAGAGEIPPSGKAVELQFRLPGLPWQEFRTVETDRRGRFRYAYRFSDDDSRGVRFLFRAQAIAQDGWPYEPGSSRPVGVRGK